MPSVCYDCQPADLAGALCTSQAVVQLPGSLELTAPLFAYQPDQNHAHQYCLLGALQQLGRVCLGVPVAIHPTVGSGADLALHDEASKHKYVS